MHWRPALTCMSKSDLTNLLTAGTETLILCMVFVLLFNTTEINCPFFRIVLKILKHVLSLLHFKCFGISC